MNESAVKEVKKVALQDNSISRRINDMSDDILSQLKDSLMKSEVFPPRLDESTDIQGKAQLPANIQYVENNSIKEKLHILLRSTRSHIWTQNLRRNHNFF